MTWNKSHSETVHQACLQDIVSGCTICELHDEELVLPLLCASVLTYIVKQTVIDWSAYCQHLGVLPIAKTMKMLPSCNHLQVSNIWLVRAL